MALVDRALTIGEDFPGNPNGGANPIGEDFLLQSGKPWVVLILLGGGLLTGGLGYSLPWE